MNGADVNARTHDGDSPLLLASKKGYETAVHQLLRAENVDPDCRNKINSTPLIEAAAKGYISIVRLLLEEGCDVNAQNIFGNSPLSLAVEYGHDLAAEEILKRQELNVNPKQWDGNYCGRTPLHWAVVKGYENMVRLLLVRGADINARDKASQTPLIEAAAIGHLSIVRLLLEEGCDINVQNIFGNSPLSLATEYGHDLVVVELLKHQKIYLNPKQWDSKYCGRTPLHWAAEKGYGKIVQLLLGRGADINARGKTSRTPLTEAAAKGHTDVVQLLLKNGADVNIQTCDGHWPLSLAIENEHHLVIEEIFKHKAK